MNELYRGIEALALQRTAGPLPSRELPLESLEQGTRLDAERRGSGGGLPIVARLAQGSLRCVPRR